MRRRRRPRRSIRPRRRRRRVRQHSRERRKTLAPRRPASVRGPRTRCSGHGSSKGARKVWPFSTSGGAAAAASANHGRRDGRGAWSLGQRRDSGADGAEPIRPCIPRRCCRAAAGAAPCRACDGRLLTLIRGKDLVGCGRGCRALNGRARRRRRCEHPGQRRDGATPRRRHRHQRQRRRRRQGRRRWHRGCLAVDDGAR